MNAWGTVKLNNGIVVNNTWGTVKLNNGIVVNQDGTVEVNSSGGKVYNMYGTVLDNYGEQYFSVFVSAGDYSDSTEALTPHADISYGAGFSDTDAFPYIRNCWLAENATGTVVITPDPGYEIKNIPTGNGITSAVKNADGSWTLTFSGLTEGFNDWFLTTLIEQIKQSSRIVSVAAEVVEESAEYFDAAFYADTYADLKAAFGYDAAQLWQHWLTLGKAEGRKARFVKGTVSRIVQYPPTTVPVQTAETQTPVAAEIPEPAPTPEPAPVNAQPVVPVALPANIGGETGFDAVAYANAYPDLLAAFGYDEAALWMHWLTFGQAEGRTFFPN